MDAGVEIRLATREVARHAVRLVTLDPTSDRVALHPFGALPGLLRADDLVVVNDAATLPASLAGRTAEGQGFELRLAAPVEGMHLTGVLFGGGDWRTRTEHRAPPPAIAIGSLVRLGQLRPPRSLGQTASLPCGQLIAVVRACAGRRVELEVDEILDADGVPRELSADALWHALYASATPVQYAHRAEALPLWTVQTGYAARPWAVEMPSAGRPLTWDVILGLRRAGIAIAKLTHAAGLGSIGDEVADRELPWPERYEIPETTAAALTATRAIGGRVIAIGTTVVRALEASGGRAGPGIATLRLDAAYRPAVVDGLVSGLHVPGESHFELLRAFASRARLDNALAVAADAGLSAHELGDACLIAPR
ncbi:MAG: S-adenosylmethionine:tRNA ribosyltransferase-isomerase [Deltaproteobacteria bacterium]|nr:S-adenosylmethionine:tRNA ribosyltransferase-isomerase [Deltaproteobacteria bacterium]